jgi:putative ABC transport system permease protein
MASLSFVALRNLVHDRVRFLITLAGIAVAIVLIFLQGGMYLGFMQSASGTIDHSAADLWIVSKDSPNFDWSRPFPERFLTKVRSTPGVAEAKALIFAWAFFKLPNGGTEQVEVIGYHPDGEPGWGEPWNLEVGDPKSVLGEDGIIIDESARKRLGGLSLGSRVEIMDQEVKVVGLTHGIRSLSTAPFVFTSYETAHRLCSYIGPESTVFILVRAAPGVSPKELQARLRERLPYVDVLTKHEYSERTRHYWTVQTGMGLGFLVVTLLAVVVGVTIVGQTVYAATMEHIREYATLRALGATDREMRSILWIQGGVNAAIGFAIAIAVLMWALHGAEQIGLTLSVPVWMYAAVGVLDVAMCLAASLVSVKKALSLDPAMVFKS